MDHNLKTIGRVEIISFPELGVSGIPVRIDTGARTSAIWASKININKDGKLTFYLFGESSKYFTGKKIVAEGFSRTVVASSIGAVQKRYKVKLLIRLKEKKIRASFTLTNRSQQVYPVLIGRTTLRGKFIVDVKKGKALYNAEKRRTRQLRSHLK